MYGIRKISAFSVILVFSALAAFFLYALNARADDHEEYLATVQKIQEIARARSQKINVLIIYTGGGGGHIAAANAIEAVLTSSTLPSAVYVAKVNPFDDGVMGACSDKACRYLFDQQYWRILRIGFALQPFGEYCIELFPAKYLQKIQSVMENPDVIISVAPFANSVFAQFASSIGAQYILIPTDFDASKFTRKLEAVDPNPDFRIFIPFEDDLILRPYRQGNIKSWVVTGYPTRKAFIERAKLLQNASQNEAREIIDFQRSQYDINSEDRVIVIGMGAKGLAGKSIESYIAAIEQNAAAINNSAASSIHVFVLTGNNTELLLALEQMKSTLSYIQLHPLGMQDAEAMALMLSPAFSDVFIGKSGGGTTSEVLTTGIPMIIDTDSHQAASHERANADLLEQRRQGFKLAPSSFLSGIDEAGLINNLRFIFRGEASRITPMENKFELNFLRELSKLLAM